MNHVIDINSVSLPYSRTDIALKLFQASLPGEKLTFRQKEEISFYLQNFAPEIYKAGLKVNKPERKVSLLFSTHPVSLEFSKGKIAGSVRPLIDFQQIVNVNNSVSQLNIGVGAFIYLGKHLGVAAGITRLWTNQILSEPVYLTQQPGGSWNRYSDGGGDFAEWFGQISWSWKWGMIGVFKDRFQWGENYHGANIISDRAPSFPRLRLNLNPARWMEFEYYHGWLQPESIDSAETLTGSGMEVVRVNKYMAANLVTFKPWKYLNLAIGNSIVYDGQIQLAYFIPVLFFKSVDHTLTHGIDNENSQMYFSISSRQIRHLNLYLTLFIDELKISRIRSSEEHNFLGWKAGLKVCDFPLKDLSFILEGTRTLPGTYQHYAPSLTYENDGYNLGQYLRDNSMEIYTSLRYRPLRGLELAAGYTFARHGVDYTYAQGGAITTYPVLDPVAWQMSQVDLTASYSICSNLFFSLGYQYRSTRGDVRYTPPVYLGETSSLVAGLRLGF